MEERDSVKNISVHNLNIKNAETILNRLRTEFNTLDYEREKLQRIKPNNFTNAKITKIEKEMQEKQDEINHIRLIMRRRQQYDSSRHTKTN